MPAITPPDPETVAVMRAAIRSVLRDAATDGPYPCPETEVKDRVAAAVRGRVPAGGLRGAIGRLIRDLAVRDRPRTGAPWHVVLPGDEARLHVVPPSEIREVVEALRAERAYPATLAAVSKRLRLTPRGRKALCHRLLAGEIPDGLSLVLGGRRRTPKLTLRGEEDFERTLRKKEQLDLRLRLADLERGPDDRREDPATTTFRTEIDAAYDRLAAEERTRFVAVPRLRRILADHDRETFDREVTALCQADLYQLSEHEHAYRLTDEDRTGSLVWRGRAYYFVSRV